jgi:very-short-patch-repair endonuclease
MRRSLVLASHSVLVAERARALRAQPTMTELIMWQVLRGSRLGVAFRRQVPVGRYIADFLAPSIKLIVEVDGGYHAGDAMVRGDARRDRYLARLGYRVARVSAVMVQHRLAEAIALVLGAIEPR